MNILLFTSFFSYTVKMSVQGLMACAGTLLIVQSFMATLADASDCIVFSQNRVFDGWSCQPFSHRDIIHVTYHHCSLACIQNQACQAFIYNKEVPYDTIETVPYDTITYISNSCIDILSISKYNACVYTILTRKSSCGHNCLYVDMVSTRTML